MAPSVAVLTGFECIHFGLYEPSLFTISFHCSFPLQVDITYRKPVLNLDLFDTTGDEDIFINQVLIDTGIAVFSENSQLETGEILYTRLVHVLKYQSILLPGVCHVSTSLVMRELKQP